MHLRTMKGIGIGALMLLALCAGIAESAHAEDQDPKRLNLRISTDGEPGSHAVAVFLISRLACHPGLALLEGVQIEALEAEINLSESELVDPETVVTDLGIPADVTAHLEIKPGGSETLWRGILTLEGKQCTRTIESTVNLLSHETAISHLADSLVVSLTDVAKSSLQSALGKSCLCQNPMPAVVSDLMCVDELLCRCKMAASGDWPRAICLAENATRVADRVKAMGKHPDQYAPLSDAQQTALDEVMASGGKGEPDEKTVRLATEAYYQFQEFSEECKKALHIFRPIVMEHLQVLVTTETPLPPISVTGDTGWSIQKMTVEGIRWNRGDARPQILLAIDFTATPEILENGRKRVLRSFQLTGRNETGESLYDYRLLVNQNQTNGGRIVTAITFDRLDNTSGFEFLEPIFGLSR
jgi:hypothetical protein